MRQNPTELSDYEKLFLKTVLENGDLPDAEIARLTKMSKATANRARKELIKKKIILEFLPIIDLDKLGVKIFMVVLFQWKGYKNEKLTQSMLSDLEKDSHVAFLASGEGGYTHIVFLGFADLAQAHVYFNRFRSKYENGIGEMVSFFIPSNEIRKQDYSDLAVKYLTTSKINIRKEEKVEKNEE